MEHFTTWRKAEGGFLGKLSILTLLYNLMFTGLN